MTKGLVGMTKGHDGMYKGVSTDIETATTGATGNASSNPHVLAENEIPPMSPLFGHR